MVSNFFSVTLNAEDDSNFERKCCDPGMLYPVRLPFLYEGKESTSSNERLRKY